MKIPSLTLAIAGCLLLAACDLPGATGLNNPADPTTPAGQAAAQAAFPNFSPPAGTYTSDQCVVLSSTTADAKIYYTTDGSTPTEKSGLAAGIVPVLGDKTRLTIKAIAVKAGMTSSEVASAAYVIEYPVNPAASFTATTGDGSVTLSWPTTIGVSGYNVYFVAGTSASTSSTKWTGGILGTTSTTVTGLTNGVQYSFVYCPVVGSTVGAANAIVTATPGTSPTQVLAVVSGTSVTVSWTPVTGATGYNVYQATGATASTASPKVATLVTGTSTTLVGLTPGEQYAYVVTNVNGIESGASVVVTATLISAAPAVPTAVPMTTVGSGSFNNGTSMVTLTAFRIGTYEITQTQYESLTKVNPSVHRGDLSLPVENISWYDALEFCNAYNEPMVSDSLMLV